MAASYSWDGAQEGAARGRSMSGRSDKTSGGQAADVAARWFVRLQDDASTGDDWLAFETWLGESAANQAAYDRVERAWVEVEDAATALTPPAQGAADAVDPPPRRRLDLASPRRAASRPGSSRRAWVLGGAALAASLAVAVVGVNQWSGASSETFMAPLGETRQVTLADGSHVWLNAGTRLDVRLERTARRVELADGEAVFDVTHDPARPFVISTGQREVRVVGTEFNLRQREGDFDLTVRRGVVEVRPAGAAAKPVRVAAGYRMSAHRDARPVLVQTTPDHAFAWTRGQLVYEAAPLSNVAADLSRSLGTPVRVADAKTGELRFSGVLVLDGRDAVLRRLEGFAPVRAEPSGEGYVIRRR